MLWGTQLDTSIPETVFFRALEQQAFVKAAGASPIAGLYIFDHRVTGHRVIYIPRTGRIQIRLDPLTGHDDRVQAAEQLYGLLQLASREAREQTGNVEEASTG
jgi:hypothetical protein